VGDPPADNIAAFRSRSLAIGRVELSGLAVGVGSFAAGYRREDPDATFTLFDLTSE
jgi:hypothetical protein